MLRQGVDVTACAYRYDYWATYLGSARFDPVLQWRFRMGYEDLQLAGTDRSLAAVTFAVYRRENKPAVVHAILEEKVRLALVAPFVVLGGDGIPRAPALRTKGRLRVGMDADITVFDPATVADLAAGPRWGDGVPWR